MALKNSIRTYKHEALKAMRETGEFEPVLAEKVKHYASLIKKPEVEARSFPAKAEDVKYPGQALKKNLVYTTANESYGSKLPVKEDMPTKYFPRPECFTGTFNGGTYIDTGLNTFKTPSKVHSNLDQ